MSREKAEGKRENSLDGVAFFSLRSGIEPLRRRSTVLAVLLALAIVPYFIDLGGSAIWDANEAFYVETPRQMLERGDYITPSFNDEPRINKPVLSYWIVAAFYHVFGVSVGVERLTIALGAMVIIACGAVLGRISASQLGAAGRGAALLAALGLASLPRLLMLGRRIFIDVWITAFMSLTLVFFALSERYPERRRLFLVLMYVAAGLGVLTKGPVAVVLPGLAFLLYLLIHRELRRVREMMLPLGAVIVGLIVVPWYAALYHTHGWEYIRSFIVSENLERYASGYGVHQDRSPWFYIPVLFGDSFPLSPVLIAAAVATWRERDRFAILMWCWIGAIVGFFSLSAGKQDLYILPTIAAVVGLIAAAIERGRLRPEWRAWTDGTVAVAAFVTAVAGIGVLWLFSTAGRVYALNGAVAVGVFGLSGGVAALALVRTRRSDGGGRGTPRRDDRDQLDVRAARPAEFRALQAGTGNRPHARIPSRSRRRCRLLRGGAAQPGLLPAAPRRHLFRGTGADRRAPYRRGECSWCSRNAITRHSHRSSARRPASSTASRRST